MSHIYSKKDKKHLLSTFREILSFYKNFHRVLVAKSFLQFMPYLISMLLILPIILLLLLAMVLDPIPWSSAFSAMFSGQQLSFEFVGALIAHPVLAIFYACLVLISGVFVFFSLFYSVTLLVRLAVYSHHHKKIKYLPVNLLSFVSWRRHMLLSFMLVIIMIIILAISIAVVFLLQITTSLLPIGDILLQVVRIPVSLALILAILYAGYRLLYSFVLLAEDTHLKALKALKKSIKWTQGIAGFFNFIALCLVLLVVYSPFVLIKYSLETQRSYYISEIRSIYEYQESLEESERSYDEVEYLTQQYTKYTWTSYIYNIAYSLLLSGLTVFALSFFYLNHNKKS